MSTVFLSRIRRTLTRQIFDEFFDGIFHCLLKNGVARIDVTL